MQVFADPGALVRDARRRHGLDQRTLARRAGTSQTQLSRIERNEVSPSVSTLVRVLGALGERLELRSERNAPAGVQSTFPDHTSERARELATSTPSRRVMEAIALSRTATRIAAAASAAR